MNTFQLVGYKRTRPGAIGGAFERAEAITAPAESLAEVLQLLLTRMGAAGDQIVQVGPAGAAITVTPVHDEVIHGFETNPYHISVKPRERRARFATGYHDSIIGLHDVGATVAALAA